MIIAAYDGLSACRSRVLTAQLSGTRVDEQTNSLFLLKRALRSAYPAHTKRKRRERPIVAISPGPARLESERGVILKQIAPSSIIAI